MRYFKLTTNSSMHECIVSCKSRRHRVKILEYIIHGERAHNYINKTECPLSYWHGWFADEISEEEAFLEIV